jgi:hypothetical protein
MGIVRTALRGVAAGALATMAMDLVLYQRARKDGSKQPFVDWELSSGLDGFDDAPAPAKVGKKLADTVGVDLPDSSAATVNNVVHWATGIGWGKVGSFAAAALPLPPAIVGVATGVGAWASSYATLAPLGIYKPITEYPKDVLWKDLSVHLVYGGVLGLAYTALRSSRR